MLCVREVVISVKMEIRVPNALMVITRIQIKNAKLVTTNAPNASGQPKNNAPNASLVICF